MFVSTKLVFYISGRKRVVYFKGGRIGIQKWWFEPEM